MVKVVADTPYADLTIQGLTFSAPQPYAAGHTLTDNEASALNQVLAENLRNNFAGTIKQAFEDFRKTNNLAEDAEVAVDQLDKDDLETKFTAYAAEYEFGVRRAGGSRLPSDPIEREAYEMAQDLIKQALKKKNVKLDTVPKEKFHEFVTQLLDSKPEIRAEAKRRVEASRSIGIDELFTPAAADGAAA